MSNYLVYCSPNRFLSAVLLFGFLIASARCVVVASELQPQPSPSPSPASNVIAVIDSIVVNGAKSSSATPSDIELLRAGAASPEATVGVGNELLTGDKIRTKDEDQVVLRVPNSQAGSDDLVFLDPNSEVAIESICAVAGRILSWAGVRFRLCTSRGTLGVEGTEFEVNITPNGEFTVLVYEGAVKLNRVSRHDSTETSARSNVVNIFRGETRVLSRGTALKVKTDGTTEPVEVTPDAKLQKINYWSDQIIKASKPTAVVTKGFVNYSADTRTEEFKKARREALNDDSDSGYLTMAKVLNDWDDGAAAQKSLTKVKAANLRESPEYMVNVAEAKRLQGNLAGAESEIERTLVRHPEYGPAYYLKAKVFEQKVARDPVNKPTEAAEIRKNLAKALDSDAGKSHINTTVAQDDLNRTLQRIGRESLSKEPWLSAGYEWFNGSSTTNLVKYLGNASISVGGRRAEGNAELVIIGDQFLLKIANEIFTGRIVGNKYAGGISFAMQFDDVDKTKGDAVLSVSGRKMANSLMLYTTPQRSGSFSFTSRRISSR